ncbi:MAG: DUF547 domain-containing protein [Fuerstiella sp.]|nr:DUF547 domain-containing protein [Fuerstiella sp.]
MIRQPYFLHQIERNILLTMNKPRVYFALVCDSIDYPQLLNEACTHDRIQKQLDTNARNF